MRTPEPAHRRQPRPSPALVRALVILPLLATGLLLCGCGDDNAPSPESTPPESAASGSRSAPIPAQDLTTPARPGTPADEAWSALENSISNPPSPPAEWATAEPDEAALRAFREGRGDSAVAVADLAQRFYTGFPKDDRAMTARWQEMEFLNLAVQLGRTNVVERLEALEKARIEDASVPEEERFGILMTAAQRQAGLLLPQGHQAARGALEKSMQDLAKRFPQRPEPYQVLLELASTSPADRARTAAESLTAESVPEEVREAAKRLLSKLDRVGKPLDLKFTALDGRQIQLADYRGKVVLIDFWATWCMPCLAALPGLKDVHQRLHPKGFEILGISFDQDKDTLTQFVKREEMPWPQYFDGKGWENEFGRQFGIESIPTLWLVDKQGILRHLDVEGDLEEKVTALLAEDAPAASPR